MIIEIAFALAATLASPSGLEVSIENGSLLLTADEIAAFDINPLTFTLTEEASARLFDLTEENATGMLVEAEGNRFVIRIKGVIVGDGLIASPMTMQSQSGKVIMTVLPPYEMGSLRLGVGVFNGDTKAFFEEGPDATMSPPSYSGLVEDFFRAR